MSITLDELASAIGGVVRGEGERRIEGVSTLESAGPGELSFLTNPRYLETAKGSRAGAILVPPGLEGLEQDLLICEEPYLALAQILSRLHPVSRPEPGIDPTASVDGTARIASSATIGAYCCVGADSVVDDGAVLYPHVVIGCGCHIGRDTVVHPHVSLYDETILGAGVTVHSGVVIGGDGFGFAQSGQRHVKIPQIGRVVVEDDVEIGANTTIDRAMLDVTRIGEGTKIDNLVMVAHNVQVGRSCLLVSQAGIAGSARLGDGVVVAGQSGVAGHVDVGDGVQVASKSAVYKSAESGARLAGIPAIDSMAWRRLQVRLGRLAAVERRLANLERGQEEE